MPRINQSVVEEIKSRCNIEDIISDYVSLKRAGSNLIGLCPFHSEKTPSFSVSPENSFFHCFGCGVGGDVITFIRKAENLDYPSAIEFLAKRAGITIQFDDSEKRESIRRERTLAMNKLAAKYFNHVLLNTPEGKEGLDYLLSRGLTMPLIRHFGLGFAPNDFGSLPSLLASRGYTDAEMSSAYLARISEKSGRPYSLFRNRVMFPIISTSGDVIAFGGRVMDDSKPKYLNSSDTPAFKKSKNLFALNFAKSECAEQMILCEGYMDVISLHGAGFSNAVATLGTAITPEQARIFKRYTKSVVICYDADEAGQNAASKAFRLLGEAGVECRIMKVKNAKDPDEYIRKYGSAAFKKLMEGSKSEFDFRFENILAAHDITVPDEKLKALDETETLISETYSAARRDIYIFSVAEKFGVSVDSIRRDVEKIIKKRDFREKKDATTKFMNESRGFGDKINPDAAKNPKAVAAESAVLGILLVHPEYIRSLRNEGKLPGEDDFYSAFAKRVYSKMLELSIDRIFEEGALGEFFEPEEMARIESMRMARLKLSDNSQGELMHCLETLSNAIARSDMDAVDVILAKRKKDNVKDNLD